MVLTISVSCLQMRRRGLEPSVSDLSDSDNEMALVKEKSDGKLPKRPKAEVQTS